MKAFEWANAASTDDAVKLLKLTGKVTEMKWSNPHAWIYLDVTGADCKVQNWACETNGPNGLIRSGWKRDSLKVGDHVKVSAFLAKDGTNTVDARMVTLPDGRKVFTGSANDGGPTSVR